MPRPRPSSRDSILRVFAEQVAEHGYAETAMSDIASMLGLSKGTIVHHFGSKENLLAEVHAAYFERRFAELDHINRTLEDPATKLAAVIYALLAGHRDDRAASLTFLREFVRFADGGLTEATRNKRSAYRDGVVSIIKDGVAQGQFITTNPTVAALHIFGSCNYAWTWYRPEGSLSVEEIATVFASETLLGLQHGDAEESVVDLTATIGLAIATVQAAPGRTPPPATPSRGRSGRQPRPDVQDR